MSEKEHEKQICHIAISRRFAGYFTLDEVINMAMRNTLDTNKEMMFLYDVETREVLSPIIAGECGGVEIDLQFGDPSILKKVGAFHTHPLTPEPLIEQAISEFKEMAASTLHKEELEEFIEAGIKEIRKTLTKKECDFSTNDLHTSFMQFPFKEIKLGCPNTNEILTLQYSPELNKILFDIATLEERTKCSSQIGKSINSWADKLDEALPQHKKEIEESRYQWMKSGLPASVDESVDVLMKQVMEKIQNYPKTRQEWKKRE